MKFKRFFKELKRRSVYQAAVSYAIMAWLIIQVASIVLPTFEAQPWVMKAVILVLIAGFPVAMVMSWIYDMSLRGITRTGPEEKDEESRSDTEKNPVVSIFMIGILLILVIGQFAYNIYWSDRARSSDITENLVSEINDKSVAVIPFRDMSPKADQKYLADGVMEAILNHLAKIKDMRVISRTSMEQYRKSDKTASLIATDLGVSYILTGSVQRITDKVRITVQFIEGNTDQQLWSENYDRDLIDIFAIQTEIATNVAEVLDATITAKERTIIEAVPTSDLTAYDYYLKGVDYRYRSNKEEDLQFASQMFKRAIEIDSTFTLAWVGLATAYRSIYWFHYDRSDEHLAETKEYLAKAINLDPDLMEVRLESASHSYQCKANYPEALEILEKLITEYPNNNQMHAMLGYIYRRMGQFAKSFEYLDHAISLEPSVWKEWSAAGYTLVVLRRYKQAEHYNKMSIKLNPSRERSYFYLAHLYLTTGEIEKARAMLLENRNIADPRIYMNRSLVELFDRNFEGAIGILESSPFEIFADQDYLTSKSIQLGLIYSMMSNMELSKAHFQDARQIFENKLNESPDDYRLYRSLGIIYAGLGMKKEAIEVGNKALNAIDVSVDAIEGFYRELDMARILLLTGQYDASITKLKFLLEQNGTLSVELLKRDPFWDPLREIEAFKTLVIDPKYQVILEDN